MSSQYHTVLVVTVIRSFAFSGSSVQNSLRSPNITLRLWLKTFLFPPFNCYLQFQLITQCICDLVTLCFTTVLNKTTTTITIKSSRTLQPPPGMRNAAHPQWVTWRHQIRDHKPVSWYSIYLPQRDRRLSWPSRLVLSVRHIRVHQSSTFS